LINSLRHSSIAAILIIAAIQIQVSSCRGQSVQDIIQKDNRSSEGGKQLNLVLQDRPQLQSIVQKGNPVWNWLTVAFSDTGNGIRIYWNGEPTSENNPERSESTFPDNIKAAYIKVDKTYKAGPSKGLELSPEEILSGLVFELNNDKHWAENQEISRLAEAGQISRPDYIRSCAKTEFTASLETADFYRMIWLPFCQSKGLQFTPRLWGMPLESTFDQWLLRYPLYSWYPWRFYGNRYDWINAQREGDVKLRLGDFDGAISDYTQALKLGPRSYFWRGISEMAEGMWDKSTIDLRQADQLSLGNLPSEKHDQLYLWIIRAQNGQKADADHNLSDYLNDCSESTKNDWLSTIGKFLLDQINETDFLAASISANLQQNKQQRCVSCYFEGMKRLLAGDKKVASQYFHNCLTSNQTDRPEYTLAREELKALDKTR
jgi:tetratricopeptide (TPR) repeat protein